MKKILFLTLVMAIIGCNPVERVGDEKTPTKTKPSVAITSTVSDESVDDWVLIRAFQGHWTVQNGENSYYDEYCHYEFYYSKKEDTFDLRMEGYKPKNHSMYESLSNVLSKINIMKIKGVDFNTRLYEITSLVTKE